jgi:hypothetical protein
LIRIADLRVACTARAVVLKWGLFERPVAADSFLVDIGEYLGETPEAGLSEISWHIGRSRTGIGGKNDLSARLKARRIISEGYWRC